MRLIPIALLLVVAFLTSFAGDARTHEGKHVFPISEAEYAGMMAGSQAETRAEPRSLPDIIEHASGAVGALYHKEDDGDMSFLCSVTAIGAHDNATVLLTAYHCVRRGISYSVTFDGQAWHAARVWKIPGYEIDKKRYPRAWQDPETDMAMFLVENVVVPTVDLAERAELRAGSSVVMVGFPLGVAKIGYEGIVSGYFDRPGAEQNGYQLLQIFGAPGSSGSAVLDQETGKIVSVLVSAKQARAGLPVIFATPIDYRRYLQEVPSGAVVGQSESGGKP